MIFNQRISNMNLRNSSTALSQIASPISDFKQYLSNPQSYVSSKSILDFSNGNPYFKMI